MSYATLPIQKEYTCDVLICGGGVDAAQVPYTEVRRALTARGAYLD